MVPERIGGYRVGMVLGSGGFGTVVAARSEVGSDEVAIKIARIDQPLAVERLAEEAVALDAIGAPHVPALYARGRLPDGRPYLVMERLSLSTLGRRLDELGGPMPLDEFAALARALTQALAAAHARGVLHRDLKPENVFVGREPARATLVDFGLARPIAPSELRAALTSSGAVVGTAEYMSPEQCAASAALDGRADIYSLGVIFYEMLTGRTPFWGRAGEVRQAHLNRRPPRPSELVAVAAPLEALVLRCLAKQPEGRPATMVELGLELEQALAQALAAPRAPPPFARRLDAKGEAPGSRRLAAMLLFSSGAPAIQVRDAVVAGGGELAYASGRGYVALFAEGPNQNPVRRAQRAGERMLASGLCARARLELAPVSVQALADGSPLYLSDLFFNRDSFPRDTDAAGVSASESAAAALTGAAPAPAADVGVSIPDERVLGREATIEVLLASARRASDENLPTLTTVIAEPGFGKSHLAAGLARRLASHLPDARILELRAEEALGGDTDVILRELLTRILELPRAAPPDRGQELLGARLGALGAELWPSVALRLGWLEPSAAEVRALAAAPGVLRAGVARALGEGLRRQASAPLALILDDAQFADEATLDALEYATLAGGDRRLWICVLARPSFAPARPAWGGRAASSQSLKLEPLDRESAAELCHRLLEPAEYIPEKAIDQLVRRTHGVPLLLVELARGIKRDGLLRQHDRSDSWFLATDELDGLPDLPLVEWLAERELAALPAGLGAYLHLASLLDAEFGADELEGVLAELEQDGAATAGFGVDPRVALDRLLGGGVLTARPGARIGFRHALVRDAVAGTVPETLRIRVHRAALRFYRHAPQTDSERLPRLALHAARAGLPEEAAARYLELATRAQGRHDYLEAERLYSRALELLPESDAPRRLAAGRGRGIMRYRVGRYEDSLDDFALARELASRLGDVEAEIEVLLDEATALDWMCEFPRSRDRVEQAKSLSSDLHSPLLEARLLLATGRSLQRFNEFRASVTPLEEAVTRSEQLGDPAYETLVGSLLLLGWVLPLVHKLDEAEATFQRLVALCRSRGDQLHLAAALNNRFFLWAARKNPSRAVKDILEHNRIGNELGVVTIEYIGEFNLAEIYYQLGQFKAAWQHIQRALEIEERSLVDKTGVRPLAAILAARLLALEGRNEEARAGLHKMRLRAGLIGGSNRSAVRLMPIEDIQFHVVDLMTRPSTKAEWQQLRTRAEQLPDDCELIEVLEMWGLSAQRQARLEEARLALEEALELAARSACFLDHRIRRELEHVLEKISQK